MRKLILLILLFLFISCDPINIKVSDIKTRSFVYLNTNENAFIVEYKSDNEFKKIKLKDEKNEITYQTDEWVNKGDDKEIGPFLINQNIKISPSLKIVFETSDAQIKEDNIIISEINNKEDINIELDAYKYIFNPNLTFHLYDKEGNEIGVYNGSISKEITANAYYMSIELKGIEYRYYFS